MRPKNQEYYEVVYQDRFFRIELEVLYDPTGDNYIASIELISEDCKDGIELFDQTYEKLQPAIKSIKKRYNRTIRRLYANVKEEL